PVSARNYEPGALAASESADLLTYLMSLPHPSKEVIASVDAGVAWLQAHAIRGYEYTGGRGTPGGRHLVAKEGASPLWARYYSVSTQKPIFGDRDKTLHDDVNDLSEERRNGYAWYSGGAQQAIDRYAVWSKDHAPTKYQTRRCVPMLLVSDSFNIGPVAVGGGKLFLIAGPCVIESEQHARKLADAIQRIAADLKMPYIFKASYDKANRTSVRSFRGPGLEEGARILRAVAKDTGLPVLTDVHTPEDCARLSDALGDAEAVLQIPAFLCRQTDLLIAAAETGRAINIKKGQFVAPHDMKHAVEKVREAAGSKPSRVFLTERGASFGYNNLVVDMRALPILRGFAPVVFDGTHSVQTPSAANGVSGGQPEFIPVLARAAVAAG